ncbi:hypothetical protein D3C78_1651470 [compost metagenome]
MRLLQPFFQCQATAGRQKSPVSQTDKLLRKKAFFQYFSPGVRKYTQCQIDLSVVQLRKHHFAAGLTDGEIKPRRCLSQVTDK